MTLRSERDLPGALLKPRSQPVRNAAGRDWQRRGGRRPAAYVERDLTGWERLLLAIGLHVACAVIAIVDRRPCQGRIGSRRHRNNASAI
jgi:hypothetical protein